MKTRRDLWLYLKSENIFSVTECFWKTNSYLFIGCMKKAFSVFFFYFTVLLVSLMSTVSYLSWWKKMEKNVQQDTEEKIGGRVNSWKWNKKYKVQILSQSGRFKFSLWRHLCSVFMKSSCYSLDKERENKTCFMVLYFLPNKVTIYNLLTTCPLNRCSLPVYSVLAKIFLFIICQV